LPSIPISPKDYNNNPELLTAMIATHLEDVLITKFMQDEKLNEDEAKDLSQVSSIHYGMRAHHPITYLVKISECVKQVSVLKKKMQYDVLNSHIYEEEMWGLYTQVTKLKDKYYKEKMKREEPHIYNAYITFRDIQARNKALHIYNMFPLKRLLVKCGCIEKKLRLNNKGVYTLTHSVDPNIIIWENTGAPFKHKCKMFLEIYSVAFLIFVITFIGFWAI
jgi:hypothetical protein